MEIISQFSNMTLKRTRDTYEDDFFELLNDFKELKIKSKKIKLEMCWNCEDDYDIRLMKMCYDCLHLLCCECEENWCSVCDSCSKCCTQDICECGCGTVFCTTKDEIIECGECGKRVSENCIDDWVCGKCDDCFDEIWQMM
ncbi:MAG: hypothetical protein PHX34_04430 [Candidatus Shapirobacteria bacterium]|nr:hypothetical protein [Candidatus Shapirobacteria bacterium]